MGLIQRKRAIFHCRSVSIPTLPTSWHLRRIRETRKPCCPNLLNDIRRVKNWARAALELSSANHRGVKTGLSVVHGILTLTKR